MLEMINRSLNLFKMERDSYDYRPEPVDILSVMRCALDEVVPMVTTRNQVALRVDNQLPRDGQKVMAMAESPFCHSMFSNLIKNAVEASPHDDVINIGFEQRRADVTVSIDNGGEVPEEIRERFFDKFVTAGKRDGTGIGTYSAKLIAQTQKGTIDLDTSVAGRTCIRVTLPAGDESECDLTAA
jgi:signal transduction histidine kinase